MTTSVDEGNKVPVSNEYEHVIEHLSRIAHMTRQCGHHPTQKRALLDMYFAATPETLAVKSYTQPALVGDQPSEWYFSDKVNPHRRILYVHGGSWMAGSSASHRGLISRIAHATNCLILAINYRLAPEFPFPQGLEDVIQGFKWLSNPAHHPDFSRLDLQITETPETTLTPFIVGDSAGGNLVLASTLAMAESSGNSTEDASSISKALTPKALVALSPAVDLTFKVIHSNNQHHDPILQADLLPLIANNYLQEKSTLDDPWVSPIFGDLSSLPPTLIQTGTREILKEGCQRFYQKALAAGANIQYREWNNMPHVFQGFAPLLPEANEAIEELANFIAKF